MQELILIEILFFCFGFIHSPRVVQSILGKLVNRPAKLDKKLARELKSLSDPTIDPYDTVIGKTMCTYDFYEGTHAFDSLALQKKKI